MNTDKIKIFFTTKLTMDTKASGAGNERHYFVRFVPFVVKDQVYAPLIALMAAA